MAKKSILSKYKAGVKKRIAQRKKEIKEIEHLLVPELQALEWFKKSKKKRK